MHVLKQTLIDTPLGSMIGIASEETLYLLEFVESLRLEWKIERLKARTKSTIREGSTKPLKWIEDELEQYFRGTLQEFSTPIQMLGTPFQRRVWEALQAIIYGTTISYSELALAIEQPTATRAVAGANRANQLAIIIPCHRVISADGTLGGYAGGIERKPKLLAVEFLTIHGRIYTTS
jgi:AraC family transcriptional regulator of adaptative response/methylated-DNA-[protein]-cysteine methyltransferase